MARVDAYRRSRSASRAVGSPESSQYKLDFLRYSHIFASLVHEILEAKFLQEVSPFALTLLQFHLLKVITLNGGLHVGKVANMLGMSPPGATKNIDKLERLGLIARTPSKGDRRATLLSPSAKGARLVQKYEDLKADRLATVFQEFDYEEVDRLAQLLERFSVCLVKQEDSGFDFCLRCAAYCEEGCPVGEIRGGCPYQRMRSGRTGDQHAGEA